MAKIQKKICTAIVKTIFLRFQTKSKGFQTKSKVFIGSRRSHRRLRYLCPGYCRLLSELIAQTGEDDTLFTPAKFSEAAQGTADLHTDKRGLEVERCTGIIILSR